MKTFIKNIKNGCLTIKMKSFSQILAVCLTSFALSSCSCAIYHKSWKSKNTEVISNTSFHQVAKETGFKTHHTSMMGYKKRDVYFSYTNNGRINLHSAFCPTPLTLLTWGAAGDAWNDRCQQAENSILESYSKKGIKLQIISDQAEAVPPNGP